ncbi:MAG: ATP-dependent helicase [Treponema sp.]|jgi:DNA helicase-2/ATP-dependent DNA helicase PcrA|nr:ATP-dependent helicase [Treponema sp.]
MEYTKDFPAYLDPLNPEQRRAVLHTGPPLLILAGAGSGKTRVITTKIAWLIRERGIAPQAILAVTFTNKAAREMAERAKSIDERAGFAMLRTFHSFGAWFLRRNGHFCGLDSNFTIYDDDDVISFLSTIMAGEQKAEIKRAAYNISRAKDFFLSPEDPSLALIDRNKQFRGIYAEYEKRLANTGNVDFGDLIKKPVEILRNEPDVRRRLRERFSVIMVDEYQDANVAQFEMLKELAGPDTYVCVVGDDDQSIYRFRGAEVKNILEFPDKFSDADIIRLESNYRSTSPILKAASSVVDHNRGRLGKTLRAERGDGKLPVLAFLPDQDEEANFCASLIEKSVKSGAKTPAAQWSDWAILYRTNAQSFGFETEFLRRRIPYKVVGSLKFYEREEIKDALALLSFLVNPRDEVAFRRMVNKPARGLGAVTVNKLIDSSLADGADLLQTAKNAVKEKMLSAKAGSGLDKFIKVIDDARSLLENQQLKNRLSAIAANNENGEAPEPKPKKKKTKEALAKEAETLVSGEGLSVCVARILKDSGVAEYHIMQDEVTGNQRLNNMQELVNAASLYEGSVQGLLEFLEHIELDRSLEERNTQNNDTEEKNRVTLITFHNTKGLEFRRVIMTGLEHGIFPREDKKDDELEEERRLFYVGATRAMDELYLTSCAMRRMYGRVMPLEPSLFLREIDKKFLRIIGRAPYGFAAPQAKGNGGWRVSGFAENEAEKASGWRRGQRLFHDDYGYGSVVDVRGSEDGPVVRAMFETGKELRFLSEQQGSAVVKINEE